MGQDWTQIEAREIRRTRYQRQVEMLQQLTDRKASVVIAHVHTHTHSHTVLINGDHPSLLSLFGSINVYIGC